MTLNGPDFYLSVVIPVYNEERSVVEAIRRVDAYRRIKGQEWEILIVNDGSTDKTRVLAENFIQSSGLTHARVLSYDKNRGKGFAVRTGVLASAGRFVLLTDADLSSPIKEVDKLIRSMEYGAAVAIGSRAIREKDGDVQQSFKRIVSGRIFNYLVRFLVLPGIRDTQCGFKCFTRDCARTIFSVQKLDGFSFDVEALYLARKKGYKINEVPVMWRQGERSSVSLFRDSFRMLADLFKIKKFHG